MATKRIPNPQASVRFVHSPLSALSLWLASAFIRRRWWFDSTGSYCNSSKAEHVGPPKASVAGSNPAGESRRGKVVW